MKPIVLYNSISNDVFIYSVCHIYNADHFDKDVLIWGEWLIPQFRKKRHSAVYEELTDVVTDLATAFYQPGKWFSSALQKFPCGFILMFFSYGYWCRGHRVRAPNSFIVKNNIEGRWEGGTPQDISHQQTEPSVPRKGSHLFKFLVKGTTWELANNPGHCLLPTNRCLEVLLKILTERGELKLVPI